MDISKISREDGIQCIQLLNFLKKARWDLTGADIDELIKVKQWVQQLATKMAEQLKNPPLSTEVPIKIKTIGALKKTKRKQ